MLLLAWGILNLVGSFATVLPLAVLPFKPEQSLRHYVFLLYALTQLPLLGIVRLGAGQTPMRHAKCSANTVVQRQGEIS